MTTLTITQADMDAHHAAVVANPASKLAARRDRALTCLHASEGFVAHRYASAYHSLAVERCDTAFQIHCWGWADRREVRAALFSHLRLIRRQIKRAKADPRTI